MRLGWWKRGALCVLTSCALAVSGMGGFGRGEFGSEKVFAGEATCETITGNNVNAQNYGTAASVIDSYLYTNAEGQLVRVRYNEWEKQVEISRYNDSYELTWHDEKKLELPIFGGFYTVGENHFVVSGDTNHEESEEKEVIRVTKYDKDWNRVSSCGLYGENTIVPFSSGSLRMTDDGKYLYVRTCHKMYKSADGLNHQANLMFSVNMDTMEVVDKFTRVYNTSKGYVSHSFNQFIKVVDGALVAVDHGDAYPRSACLIRYNNEVGTGVFSRYYCGVTNILTFEGEIGQNYTGCSLGGFEVSDSSYLVALNNAVNFQSKTRNVILASVSRSDASVKLNKLTDYEENKEGGGTPHLVALGDGNYLVLWSYQDKVCYAKVDGEGNLVGSVMELDGELSDCAPIVRNGKVIWYTVKNEKLRFYELAVNDLTNVEIRDAASTHSFVDVKLENGILTQKCEKCGETRTMRVITKFVPFFNTEGPYASYTTLVAARINVGETLYYWLVDRSEESADNRDFEVKVTPSEDVKIESDSSDGSSGGITFRKAGSYTVTIYPRYNPSIQQSIQVWVLGDDVDDGSGTGGGTDVDDGSGTGGGTDVDDGSGTGDGTDVDDGSGTGGGTDVDDGSGTGGGTDVDDGNGSGGNDTDDEVPEGISGDVDMDGNVTLSDAQLALRAALAITPVSEEQIGRADFDLDGKISLSDVMIVLKKALNII